MFYHNLSFRIFSQLELLSFVTIWLFLGLSKLVLWLKSYPKVHWQLKEGGAPPSNPQWTQSWSRKIFVCYVFFWCLVSLTVLTGLIRVQMVGTRCQSSKLFLCPSINGGALQSAACRSGWQFCECWHEAKLINLQFFFCGCLLLTF